jgi:CheY-like chemotaxis protein
MIVDDDPLMHALYKNHLERAGYSLLSARDGAEALGLAIKERPSLIFMDIMMPEMDGIAALRQLKASEEAREIPVVVITANVAAHEAARQEALMAGAVGFLSKPFSPNQLLDQVRKILQPPAR